MTLDKLCTKVVGIAHKTGEFIRNEKQKLKPDDIISKGLHDLVSYVDKTAEEQIIHQLSALIPGSSILAEESGTSNKGSEYQWIIDPLDGTTNYIHGLSPAAISIALQKNNKTVLGVVYEHALDECFYAWKNGGAFLNNKRIHVSKVNILSESLIATGFPYNDFSRLNPFMKSLEHFMYNTHGVRRLGSAATDLVYVACGRFEAFYEYSLHPWDVAAGALIVEEAGGQVSDFSGGDNYLFGKEIIASNSLINKEFSEAVKKYLL